MTPVIGNQCVHYRLLGAALLVSTVAIGCAASNNMALERARSAYAQAQQNPEVSSKAAVALHEAEAALRRTEQTWEATKDEKEVAHLAYITEKRVDIAQTVAEQKKSEAEARQLNEEREHVIIAARTNEAARAQAEARARARAAEQAQREAQEATTRATQLEQELAALKAKQTERGLVLTLGDVLFEYNQADLKPGAMQNLYQLVTFLKENPTRNLLIEGHTDSTGSDSYNLELSQRRAEAVQGFLIQNGVSSERIDARGYGKAYPVASNNTEAGRQQNRRVEVVILKAGESAAGRARF